MKGTVAFLIVGILFVLLPLTPLDLRPNVQLSPDFLFCFIFITLVRNQKQVSIFSILFICLLADFLWYRPIGLTTLTFILTSEILRQYLIARKKIGLFEELICISSIYIIITSIEETTKFFTLIPSLPLGDIIVYALLTLLLYFLIAMMVRVFGSAKLL
jgi:rod shape-determining protein MreD